jgi:hypothetical protein
MIAAGQSLGQSFGTLVGGLVMVRFGGFPRPGVGCDHGCKAVVGGRILPGGVEKVTEVEKAADPKAGGVSNASSDDVSVRTSFVGVGGDGFVSFEVQIALDQEPQFAAYGARFVEADVAPETDI